MATTTWSTEGGGATSWTTESGALSQLVPAGTTGSASQNFTLNDNQLLYFGNGYDYSISYDSTQDRLEFNDVSGITLLSLSTSGILLDKINLNELTSLPTATEGSLVYYNNEYYLGFPA